MNLIKSLIVAAVVAVPVVSFAQSSQPVTRAQVRAEVVQLEKAGYNRAGDDVNYPRNIQAAEARVNAQNQEAASAYGPSTNGSSASGSPALSVVSAQDNVSDLGPIYAHH
jgi:hypothetical protein